MPKKKFSISLEDSEIAEIDSILAYHNAQFLVKIDRAKVIRQLILAGIKAKESIFPGCQVGERNWIHLIDNNIVACGRIARNVTTIENEDAITCPHCKLIARHHASGRQVRAIYEEMERKSD